jgi:hemolysin III
MVFLYLASGLFHGLPFTAAQNRSEFRFFQRLDQSAIYILIAGTNTPVQTMLLDGRWRKWCLIGMWALAGVGIACLWLLPTPPHAVIVANCLAMGWLGLLPVRRYYQAVGWRAMNWIWAGCALYTIGALCELTEWPVISESPVRIGFHETFHVITAAASIAFFMFILRFAIPYQKPASADRCELTINSSRSAESMRKPTTIGLRLSLSTATPRILR